jgi:SAM-dependent methyltransferase
MNKTNRLYNDLAWVWPLLESVEEYRQESEDAVKVIKEFSKIGARTLLDITCGGGKEDFTFKEYFDVTGLDLSEKMLENARKLNPECEYVAGDMRNFDLPRQFDAIFINDGRVYVTTEEDLRKTYEQAYRHLRPGGVMITFADDCKEYFRENKKQNRTQVTTSVSNEPHITFIENCYDPDPDDTTFEINFLYLIRERGKLRIEHDFHTLGLFTLETWRNTLKSCGFEVHERDEVYKDEKYKKFICVKPL